jgi:hypothetical protein
MGRVFQGVAGRQARQTGVFRWITYYTVVSFERNGEGTSSPTPPRKRRPRFRRLGPLVRYWFCAEADALSIRRSLDRFQEDATFAQLGEIELNALSI